MSFFISFYRKKLYFDKLVKHLNQIFAYLEVKNASYFLDKIWKFRK